MLANVPKSDQSKKKKLVNSLMRYSFFSSFSAEEIALLLFCSERVKYDKEAEIFKEGDIGTQFYAILKGRIDIRKEASGRILAQLTPGEVFGEMAVLDNQPRSATAVAATAVELFAFDGHRLLNDFPHLSVKLLRYLARELSKRLRQADMLLDRF